jgi:hypothetical protein
MQFIGIHRIRRPEGLEDSVWVTSGTSFEVPESDYRKQGYRPPLDSLPWRNESPLEGKPQQA